MNTNRFQAPREKGQKPTGKRWFMLSLIFVLTAINYLDRTNMAVAAPSMSAELGFDVLRRWACCCQPLLGHMP